MEKSVSSVLNELLVKTFNDILAVEEYELRKGPLNNLSLSEIHTIEAIGMYQTRTMSQVATNLSITMGALTSAVNNLVKKGYVNRERDDRDRRVVKIALTRSGKLAYRIHEKFHHDMVKQTIKGLTEKENILIESLRKLNDFLVSKYTLKKCGKGN
ncbi:MAG: MarR family transcriptional regulator [Gracilibacter sp. BRH_c7a]|nr:MAG: MarR family transcriptional regulator [Gracilibacter sp. BRH_c7a]